MDIEFNNTELEDYYEGRPVKNKLIRGNKAIQKSFLKAINTLKAIQKIEDLYLFNGLNYEKLSGDRKGQSSIRINQQFRLLFTEIENKDNPIIIELLIIEEISNHYK
jgi:toxin HigB-1